MTLQMISRDHRRQLPSNSSQLLQSKRQVPRQMAPHHSCDAGDTSGKAGCSPFCRRDTDGHGCTDSPEVPQIRGRRAGTWTQAPPIPKPGLFQEAAMPALAAWPDQDALEGSGARSCCDVGWQRAESVHTGSGSPAPPSVKNARHLAATLSHTAASEALLLAEAGPECSGKTTRQLS